jgi:hypothetical protein
VVVVEDVVRVVVWFVEEEVGVVRFSSSKLSVFVFHCRSWCCSFFIVEIVSVRFFYFIIEVVIVRLLVLLSKLLLLVFRRC